MKSGTNILQDGFIKKLKGFLNKDIAVFAFFLLLSFVFWYLNALSKVTESEIKYSAKYINIPKERVIVADEPVILTLTVKGTGYSIVNLKLTYRQIPLAIDLSTLSYKRVLGSRDLNYFLLTSGITKNLSSLLKTGCEVTSIKPDTLFFILNRIPKNSASGNTDTQSIESITN